MLYLWLKAQDHGLVFRMPLGVKLFDKKNRGKKGGTEEPAASQQ